MPLSTLNHHRGFYFYLLPLVFIAIAWIGISHQGLWTFAGAISLFLVHPLLDNVLLKFEEAEGHEHHWMYDFSLYLIFPALLALLFHSWSAILNATSEIEMVGVILSSGLCLGTFGITSAHELVHRKSLPDRTWGLLTLTLVHFTHFSICHIRGHHKNVATPLDPATARRDQSIYSYMPQALFGEWLEAVKLENERLQKKTSSLWQRLLYHRVAIHSLISVILFVVVFQLGGAKLLWAWIFQTAVAITLLLTVDYLEHYGLQRKALKPGVYEPIRAWHSWDSKASITNWGLFNLGLHSEHHLKVQKKYAELFSAEGALQMPYGYSAMFLLAYFPHFFTKKMNLIIDQSTPSHLP